MECDELKFPYHYWGLYLCNLERGEEVYQELLKMYDLDSYDDNDIEEAAVDRFAQVVKYCESDKLGNLANIITECRIVEAINCICDKRNLNYEDFDWDVNGCCIGVYYKREQIA